MNTMARSLAASGGLGFDGTQAAIVADPRLDTMIIEVEAVGRQSRTDRPVWSSARCAKIERQRRGHGGQRCLLFLVAAEHTASGQQDGIHLC